MKLLKKLFGTRQRTFEDSVHRDAYIRLAEKYHTTPEYVYELAHKPVMHAKSYDDMRILDDLVKEGVLVRHEDDM